MIIIASINSETNNGESINSLFHAHQASKETVVYQYILATVTIHHTQGDNTTGYHKIVYGTA